MKEDKFLDQTPKTEDLNKENHLEVDTTKTASETKLQTFWVYLDSELDFID